MKNVAGVEAGGEGGLDDEEAEPAQRAGRDRPQGIQVLQDVREVGRRPRREPLGHRFADLRFFAGGVEPAQGDAAAASVLGGNGDGREQQARPATVEVGLARPHRLHRRITGRDAAESGGRRLVQAVSAEGADPAICQDHRLIQGMVGCALPRVPFDGVEYQSDACVHVEIIHLAILSNEYARTCKNYVASPSYFHELSEAGPGCEKHCETVREGKLLVSDGAWGTLLQQQGLKPGDCPELWCVERRAGRARHRPQLCGGRRGHDRDQQLRRQPLQAGPLRPGSSVWRN